MAEEDTWENRENLKNAKGLVEEFKKIYGEEAEELRQQELKEEEKEFSQELPREFMAKLLYGWGKRKYKRKRERRWDENWSQWKNSLGQGNLKGGPYYESSKKKTVFHAFKHFIQNLKSYNRVKE